MTFRDETPLVALRAPHPLDLCHAVTDTLHYHCGISEHDRAVAPAELGEAMERLARRCATRLVGRRRILDVGCGMGGTAALLARLGHDVLGIDPSAETIAFARARAGAQHGLRFEVSTLEHLAPTPFDGIVLLEVGQHFRDVSALLAHVRGSLVHGGTAVFCDPVLLVDAPWSSAPFQRAGRLAELALAAGCTVVDRVRLDREVMHWLVGLGNELERRGALLIGGAECAVEREGLAEFARNVRALAHWFAQGALGYEEVVLEVAPS